MKNLLFLGLTVSMLVICVGFNPMDRYLGPADRETSRKLDTGLYYDIYDDDVMIYQPDYSEMERQMMEERQEQEEVVPSTEYSDYQLDQLQKDKGIFYGYPGASGASGAPGPSASKY